MKAVLSFETLSPSHRRIPKHSNFKYIKCNKTVNIRINVTLCHETIVALEKQEVLHICVYVDGGEVTGRMGVCMCARV
jgi:hypothetical protein